ALLVDRPDLLSFPTRRSSDLASTGFNHLLGHQVGRFCVTKACVDVGNDRYNVGFEVVDLADQFFLCGSVALGACCVQVTEQVVRSEEHTSELQSRENLVCRLL